MEIERFPIDALVLCSTKIHSLMVFSENPVGKIASKIQHGFTFQITSYFGGCDKRVPIVCMYLAWARELLILHSFLPFEIEDQLKTIYRQINPLEKRNRFFKYINERIQQIIYCSAGEKRGLVKSLIRYLCMKLSRWSCDQRLFCGCGDGRGCRGGDDDDGGYVYSLGGLVFLWEQSQKNFIDFIRGSQQIAMFEHSTLGY